MYSRITLIFLLIMGSLSRASADDFEHIAFNDFDDTLYIDFIETINNDTLTIDFSVRSCDNIQSLQFTIANSDNIRFVSLEDGAIEGAFNSNLVGAVGYTWFDNAAGSITLEDGTVLFSIKYVLESGSEGEVRIVDEPVDIEVTNGLGEMVLLITDGLNYLFEGNLLSGVLFADWNDNCEYDNGETLLRDWILTLEENGVESHLKTDRSGNYRRYLEGGEYTLNIVPKNGAWLPCEETVSFSLVEGANEEYKLFTGVKPRALCPQPEISVVNPALRRCVENPYFFNYCNYGSVSLDSTHIKVDFDPELTFKSASIDDVTVEGNTLFVNGGSLEIGECKNFLVVFEVACEGTDLGQTLCVKAEIGPYVNCDIDPLWSGANVEVEASCEGGEVKFVVKNTGEGNMSVQKSFIVIEDDVMMPQFEDDYDLEKGDSIVKYFPSNGKTYRLVAEQEDNHPNPNMPTAAVEACGTDEEGNYSIGYFTQFASDDNAVFVDEFCTEIIGSFDPNDKKGFPRGYGDLSYIYNSTDMEYLIRFQNTGNDTAFNVVITDELIQEMDLQSIQVGPASHPYTWDIEEGNLIVFKFENILLPDSNVNLAGSNGFIKYKVRQTPGNRDGIKLTNEANIYFDFNEPILTNTTTHTIGSTFIISDIIDKSTLDEEKFLIYPNPVQTGVWIEKTHLIDSYKLRIYGTEGRLLYQTESEDYLNYLPRSVFQNGVNFYKINTSSGEFFTGKIVVLN